MPLSDHEAATQAHIDYTFFVSSSVLLGVVTVHSIGHFCGERRPFCNSKDAVQVDAYLPKLVLLAGFQIIFGLIYSIVNAVRLQPPNGVFNNRQLVWYCKHLSSFEFLKAILTRISLYASLSYRLYLGNVYIFRTKHGHMQDVPARYLVKCLYELFSSFIYFVPMFVALEFFTDPYDIQKSGGCFVETIASDTPNRVGIISICVLDTLVSAYYAWQLKAMGWKFEEIKQACVIAQPVQLGRKILESLVKVSQRWWIVVLMVFLVGLPANIIGGIFFWSPASAYQGIFALRLYDLVVILSIYCTFGFGWDGIAWICGCCGACGTRSVDDSRQARMPSLSYGNHATCLDFDGVLYCAEEMDALGWSLDDNNFLEMQRENLSIARRGQDTTDSTA